MVTNAQSRPPPSAGETSLGEYVGPSAPFPVVGVGASAGGLEAFSQMLRHLPTDSGMGFVLISHLDPDHESTLVDILSRTTSLPVVEISAGLRVEPNHVYVLPPGKAVGIERGVLKLRKRSKSRVPHRPIDFFFESLSRDQGELAIGVVLSGTATDGTMGLGSIKAEGGITFAQDDSAKHSSMPRSAIAAGCVDLVLSPADIAAELTRIAKHPRILRRDTRGSAEHTGDRLDGQSISEGASPGTSNGRPVPPAPADDEAGGWRDVEKGYEEVLSLLHQSSGVDFSLYKPSTIRRRINRRMILTKHVTLAEYAEFVRDHSSERELLYSDVLINVTSFFRNPEMFDALRLEILPELVERRGNDPIRCWVIGCSTGQEAYSIAMSFAEAADESQRPPHVQIFATDVNETSLGQARHGLYSKTMTADLSPERLRRFFVEEQGGYRVGKSLRETVVFARHDLIADPPFSRLDLISCRNVLIYLQPSVQQRAIPTFHYSLKPGGLLVLGASESIGRYTDLFSSVAKKHRIFTRKPGPRRALHLPIGIAAARSGLAQDDDSVPAVRPKSQDTGHGELDAQREADRVTINRYGPPGVVIDSELQILQFRGATGAFLEPPIGKASFDVLKMAKEGLMLPLRAAISQAKKTDATAHRENVRFQSRDVAGIVNLEVIPLGTREERYFLILFQESPSTEVTTRPGTVDDSPVAASRPRRRKDGSPAGRIANLEAELADMREYLLSVQEQHATDHEELQTVNEEAQSANEELQSLNEELETSKEEIESINEELNTVNEEMNARNVELKRLNNDLLNLQLSTKLAILVLKPDLTLRDFSPQASAQFDLYRGDVGRPISLDRLGLELTDGTPALEDLAAAMLEDLHEREHEVRDRDGQWHLLRVRPYVTMESQVDGVVVVLIAIDALKRSEQAARHSVAELAMANRVMNEFVASLAHELRGPLAPIVNALNLMRQSPDGAGYAGTQEMLERQVEHMVHLLDDLLDASRVSRGTIEIRPRQIDLMSAVQIALDDARPACARKEVEIVVALPSEPIICHADPTRIAQVVSNLLNNACKFTDEGGRVDLSVVREHDRAVITVRDTGIGIAADQLPHIFELFMQVGSPLERGEGGLGIGLTLVKDLVERHGGTVEARSDGPGRGSEFEVRLPLDREVANEENRDPGEADRSRATTVLEGRRILVVDDNRDSAESMAWLLELAGNETRTAHEGVSALEAAAAFRPDVMLLDVGLPGLNGHEVARRIRAESWGADITLVAVTGWGQEEDRRKSREAGFDAHMVKPVGQAELLRVIAEHH